MSKVTSASSDMCIKFGRQAGTHDELHLPMSVLAGDSVECVVPGLKWTGNRDGIWLYERNGLMAGVINEPRQADLGLQSERLYNRILRSLGSHHLIRVWNYVPEINQVDASGLENYRAFCRGRSCAFESWFGAEYRRSLSAASAVGGVQDKLFVVFLASATEPVHVENPEQLPAYDYPEEHGPRSPSFARATMIDDRGIRLVCISGTAAVKGHQTVAVGDLRGQIACMLDNLQHMSESCSLRGFLGDHDDWHRQVKVYLRHENDLSVAQELLAPRLCRSGDRVIWLRSDICRADLLIEAEVTLTKIA